MSSGVFSQATSGWRRMVPVADAGRVEEHGVERLGRLPVEDVGGDGLGGESEAGEVGGEPLRAGWRRYRRR